MKIEAKRIQILCRWPEVAQHLSLAPHQSTDEPHATAIPTAPDVKLATVMLATCAKYDSARRTENDLDQVERKGEVLGKRPARVRHGCATVDP